ncbi:unnamed protein product, partial [Discosporangium mesarthrocarpum]
LSLPLFHTTPHACALQVRHVLTHSTGLQHALPDAPTFDVLCDWGTVTRMLEGARPTWPPGSRSSYHYFTFGWLVAAIVERVSGGVKFAEVRGVPTREE